PEDVSAHPQALERFQREARAASSLSHPNICVIYDVGSAVPSNGDSAGGRPAHFIAMEMLEGKTLKHLLDGKPLELDHLLEIALQICDGLAAAHNRGMIHRDIKPANVFILNRSQSKILVFGLAKLINSDAITMNYFSSKDTAHT